MNYRILLLLLSLCSCAHQPVIKNNSSGEDRLTTERFKTVKVKEPVFLRLKVTPGEVEKTKFNSASKTEAYEGGSLTDTIEESIDFLAKAEVTKITSPNEFTEKITTSKKDGPIELHDFAMPEPGEELVITYNSSGKVLKANDFSSDSLYFVPPVSLPADKVNVGDTWNLNTHWVTDQGVPLSLDLVSILKAFVECGNQDICADIELSGEVRIDSNLAGVSFKSLWKGRVLFAVERGSLLWSLVESHEIWTSEKVHREVKSCLESTLIDPAGWNPWPDESHRCNIPIFN